MASPGQPGQPREGAQGVRRPHRSSTRSASASARASGSASSAATATARPPCSNLMAGLEEPDAGRVSRNRGLHLGYLDQRDDLDRHAHRPRGRARRLRRPRVGRRLRAPARSSRCCSPGSPLDRAVARALRRRAPALLAGRGCCSATTTCCPRRAHQPPRRRGGGLAGRAPGRAVRPRWWWSPTTAGSSTRSAPRPGRCTTAVVDAYDGGYAAFVLAKAERQRQAAASESRRQNLVRKELAWLRRGPPARTSKPKFRIDAANALIEDEPRAARPARAAAVRHPAARQGRHRPRGRRPRPRRAARCSRTRPGGSARATGSGWSASTAPARPPCSGLVAGELRAGRRPASGTGRTVALEHLTQALDHLDPSERVLRLGRGRSGGSPGAAAGEITASSMLERFGFTGDRLTARHRRPVRWRAPPVPAAAAAARPSRTCCCSTSRPTTSTSRR